MIHNIHFAKFKLISKMMIFSSVKRVDYFYIAPVFIFFLLTCFQGMSYAQTDFSLSHNIADKATQIGNYNFNWSNIESTHAAPNVMSEVNDYKAVFERCISAGQERLAIRSFRQEGTEFRVTVDPQTLITRIEPLTNLNCNADLAKVESLLKGTPYQNALNVERTREDLIQNSGLVRALSPVNGYFLTADLCPSSKPGFNEELFETLEQAKQVHGKEALPVALSISGGWLRKHGEAFDWLNKQMKEGKLNIIWTNHTNNHPYNSHLDIDHNFMRESGIDVLAEILDLEKMLVERGIAPSVFFRFPGLVSSPELIEQLERLHLIALGSDAWLAKGQQPKLGSVILIHANLNEQLGVKLMLEWVSRQKSGSVTFLPLSDIAKKANNP
ncbi:MAG: hypothetical protein RLZZ64_208 [Bacteroidota bacterium]